MGRINAEQGFTLVELLLAVVIFSMVMAGLAVIHSSAFKQGGRMVYDARIKHMATISHRALQMEITEATRLDIPGPGASGRHVRGFKNIAVDGFQPINGIAGDTRWFHFCVSNNIAGSCGLANYPVGCLWYYSAPGAAPPVIDDGVCGNDAGGVKPQLLATHIASTVTGIVGADAYFTRDAANGVSEDNQVRANFRLMQGATQNIGPPIRFEVDASFNMNFSGT